MKTLVTRRLKTLAEYAPPISEEQFREFSGETKVCQECGAQFQLEAGDQKLIRARLIECDGGVVGLNDFVDYFVPCGECGHSIKISSSPAPTKEDYELAKAAAK